MNRKDRETMMRLYRCATTGVTATTMPSNPADIGGTVRTARAATDRLRRVASILSDLAYGDPDEIVPEDIVALEVELGLTGSPR